MSSILNQLFLVSVLSAAMISAVVIVKALFKNKIAVKAISLLWALVLLRLLLPYTFQSPIYIGDVFPKVTSVYTPPVADESTYINEYENTGIEEEDIIPNIEIPPADAEYNTPETQTVSSTSPKIAKIKAIIQEIDLSVVLATLWITVGLGIIAHGVFTLARFNKKLKGESIVSKKLYDAYKSAQQSISTRANVRIIESSHVDIPITYGLINPRIVIPQKMTEEIDKRKLQLIIMHELMHIKKLDILKNYLWLMAKSIHWFNPLVWVGYKMYLSDMEIACDTKVMHKIDVDDHAEYSNSLVEAAKILNKATQKTYPVVLNFCENKSKLRRRIMNILNPIKQSKKQTLILTIMIIIIALCCFTTACQKSSAEKPDENTTDSATNSETEKIENNTNLHDDIMQHFVSAATSDEVEFPKYQEFRMTGDVDVRVFLSPDMLYRSYLPKNDTFHTKEIEYMEIDEPMLEKTADYFLKGTYVDRYGEQEYDLSKYYTLNHADKPGDLILRAYTKEQEEITLQVWDGKLGTGIYYARGGLATARKSLIGEHSVHKVEIDKYIESSYINKAYNQAKVLVDEFSSSMELSNIYAGKFVPLGSDLLYSEYDLYAQSNELSLAFLFTPKTDGVSSLFGQMSMDTEKRYDVIDYIENVFFEFEYMLITIDEEGVASFEWRNIRTQDDENLIATDIISPEDAAQIAIDHIFDDSKELWPNPSTNMVIIHIDYMYLSMYPLADVSEVYTLYPVYAFSGKQTSGLEQINYTIIINAVDGSLIYQN